MRKNHALVLVTGVLFMGLVNLAAAYDRTVLVEDFTNWGCPPCAPANVLLHNVMESLGPDLVFDIAYHMSWPSSNDPFYLANTSENDARRYYYGVNAVPHMRCDGLNQMSTTSQSAMESLINSRLAISSRVWMDIEIVVNGNNLDITCTTVSDVDITGNKVLHMLVLDRYSYLPATPNGNPNHYHAMLDMVPSSSGQSFNSTAFDTAYWYGTSPMDPSWQINNLDVACFIQDNTTWEVLQARVEQVPVNFPGLYYMDYTLEDNGNNDGRAEPGETAYMYVTLGNQEPFQTAVNVVGTLSTDDPDLTITTPSVSFPDIVNGGSGTNVDPFVFDVNPDATPHPTTVHLEVVADPLATVMTADIDLYIGWPEILLVDDDAGGIFEDYYISTLENLGKSYQHWDINAIGAPTAEDMAGFPYIIWFTGFVSSNILTTEEQTLIENCLDGGGRLFLTGQNIAQSLNSTAPDFLHNVLLANFEVANTQNRILDGVTGNPVGEGLTLDCNYGGQGAGNCTSPDGITVLAPADEAFIYSGSSYRGGLTYVNANEGKLFFLSVPFEAVSGQNGTSTREEVLLEILDFFGPVVSVKPEPEIPISYAIVEAHPNPFNPVTSISFELPRSGTVQLDVYDVSGSLVATLVNGWCNAGAHAVTFDANGLSSGVYVYRLTADQYSAAGKMVLMK